MDLRSWMPVFLTTIVGATVYAAQGVERQCEGAGVSIQHHSSPRLKRDATLACEAALAATDFLGRHGLNVQVPIRIAIVDDYPQSLRRVGHSSAFGYFVESENRAYILSRAACSRRTMDQPPFGEAFGTDLYRSFVVHEVAHIIVAANHSAEIASTVAHEYVAYVVQLSTMPPSLRERIVANAGLEPYKSFGEMSELYYALNPEAFAIKVYGHFRNSVDRAGVLKAALSGQLGIPDEFY